MPTLAVRAEGLSKQYRIGQYQAGYETLRDTIAHWAHQAFRRHHAREYPEIWALENVSFEVAEGEVVGFIGRNGAGKSTLLKILTRITPPTSGFAEIRGRMGSILEVGTGFHPELTGRENVFLNGSILGMSRREVRAKLPEIIEFSGIEKFMDTPVKRYSSGMYVRLAFAVAAHLEPEVLFIDEVLAVGDYEFQQRCMGRIEEIGQSGRTVLFVSHDMSAVSRLCDRAYCLDGGRIILSGASADVVAGYLQSQAGAGSEAVWEHVESAPGDDLVKLRGTRVIGAHGRPVQTADVREPIGVELSFDVLRDGDPIFPKIKVTDHRGTIVFNAFDTHDRWQQSCRPGTYVATAWIPGNLLNEGALTVDVGVVSLDAPKLHHHVNVDRVVSFHVEDPVQGDSSKGLFTGQLRGAVRPLLDWDCRRLEG